ncbi:MULTISPECIES: hypothetical protein [Rhodococcoides]|uniref:Uncharacterized protein n=1 Tax=Rhodococcoides corynebacterioides TaxID=53972 RepID=A0ABS7P6V9_9NOCA|nr:MULTISPECIES: hypothetical protein [Rhodococcus]MBT1190465.1 hypothetical protein [Rhodococcus kroppenstedtii]MBY6368075.1 hypothetical protein [Rhodococcus corynebacterioides]MBY6409798.1 hypothetical protein [Rhodococcus corynebacterioides]
MNSESAVVSESSGVVRADRDQFAVATTDANVLDVTAGGSLIEVGPGFVSVFTGVSYGPVHVTLRVLAIEPSAVDESWEVVEEAVVEATSPMFAQNLDGKTNSEIAAIPAGSYQVRVHASGRDEATSLEVSEPTERYRFDFWPYSGGDGTAVATLVKTDRAWSIDHAGGDAITPDYTCVYAHDALGGHMRVPIDSDEARKEIELKKFAGGLDFDGWSATDSGEAKKVAYLDPGVVTWLSHQTSTTLAQFNTVCVREAIAQSGLDRHRWVVELVEQALASQRIGDYYDIVRGVESDPRIPKRIVPGLPGSFEVVQQHEAVKTLAGFFDAAMVPYPTNETSPLAKSLECYWYALATFGFDNYRALISKVRSRFSIPINQ